MAETTITVGAPSLTGKAAAELIKELEGATFPLSITFRNLAHFPLCFPEVKGLSLRPCTEKTGHTVTLAVTSYDVLARALVSAGQVAKLNRRRALLEVKWGEPDAEATEDEAEAEAEEETVEAAAEASEAAEEAEKAEDAAEAEKAEETEETAEEAEAVATKTVKKTTRRKTTKTTTKEAE